MEHPAKSHYDDLDDALIDLVDVLGGYKKVGPMLWPSLPTAADRLRHSLNKSRREKLDQHETLHLLALGRAADFHAAKHFLDDQTGYQRSEPRSPADDELRAIRAVESAAEALKSATVALDRVRGENKLRSVK